MCWVFWGKGRLYASCHSGLHLTDWRRGKLELRHIPLFSSSLRFCPALSTKGIRIMVHLWRQQSWMVCLANLQICWYSVNDSMQTKHILHQMGTSEIASHEDLIYFLLFLKIKLMADFLCGLSLELRLNRTFSFLDKNYPDPANNMESFNLCLTHQEISQKWWIFTW